MSLLESLNLIAAITTVVIMLTVASLYRQEKKRAAGWRKIALRYLQPRDNPPCIECGSHGVLWDYDLEREQGFYACHRCGHEWDTTVVTP